MPSPRAPHLTPAIPVASLVLCLSGCTVEGGLQSNTTYNHTGYTVVNALPDDTTPPIAVCSASSTTVAPGDAVDLFGAGSYDPDELDVTSWRWELVTKPNGSHAALTADQSATADLSGFVPDLIGDYLLSLTVTNQLGNRSQPCAVSLTAQPDQALWIELTWQWPGDNLDLHLLAPGGSPGTELDCGGADCTGGLSWGPGGTEDDPIVLHDEVDETGPEILALPQPLDATYTLMLHDNPDSTRLADNEAIVRVYIQGILAWQTVTTVADENSVVPLAELHFPLGTITPL